MRMIKTFNAGGAVYDLTYHNGKVYVADFKANRIVILNEDLEQLDTFPSPTPHAVEVFENKIYTASYPGGGVYIYSEGTDIQHVSPPHDPVSFAVEGDNIYIADYKTGTIYQNGRVIYTNPAVTPHGIDVQNGILYIADRRAGIRVIYPDGKEDFYNWNGGDPLSIHVDGIKMYTTDYASNSLKIWEGGSFLIQESKLFKRITNAVPDKKGNLYTCEEGSPMITKFTL